MTTEGEPKRRRPPGKRGRKRSKDSGKLSSRQIVAAKKRAEALEYRLQGYTFEQIAQAIGCTQPRAWQLVDEALTAIKMEGLETARTLELMRLDAIQARHFGNAVAGDMNASGMVLKVMERRSRLMGLDAPEKKEVTGKDGGPIQQNITAIEVFVVDPQNPDGQEIPADGKAVTP